MAVRSDVRTAGQKVERGARGAERRTWFRRAARAALVSRSVVYGLIGGLTFEVVARNRPSARPDSEGAFQEIARQPGGPALLALLALGLAGYAGFRFVQAAAGQTGAGSRAALTRLGWAASGALYVVLCVDAAQLVAGASGASDFDPRPLVGSVLRWPAGSLLVGASGLVVAGAGVSLGLWGAVHDYGEVLERRQIPPAGFLLARVAGAVGDAGRGLVVVLFASYLVDSAVTGKASHAKSVDAALQSLVGVPAGREVLAVLAFGLLVYALYSLVEARYRRI